VLAPQERNAAITDAVDQAFSSLNVTSSKWNAEYLSIQKDRLVRLLYNWMQAIEEKRAPFTVEHQEQLVKEVPVGPLLLSLRADRIDRVDQGLVLIDYKTGADSSPSSWLGDRIDQPQLPVYTTLMPPGDIAAVTFATLRPGKEMRMRGFQVAEGV